MNRTQVMAPVDGSTLRADPATPVQAVHAGVVPYREAWQRQRERNNARARGEVGDLLLTLEHPKVVTLGTSSKPEHLLRSDDEYAALGIDVVRADRGGDVTFHGPGQLVAYPVLALAEPMAVVRYVRALEEVAIRTAASFGVEGRRVDGLTGVWVGDDKLVALGARVRRGVTMHGIAINVTTDLAGFDHIVACGIRDRGVCSLASLGVDTTVAEVLDHLRLAFADVFACEVHATSP